MSSLDDPCVLTSPSIFPTANISFTTPNGPLGSAQTTAQPRHERRALDLFPLIRREICLRRHNDLLPFCLLSNLAFSMVATAMMPSPFISYQKLYRSGFPGPS